MQIKDGQKVIWTHKFTIKKNETIMDICVIELT